MLRKEKQQMAGELPTPVEAAAPPPARVEAGTGQNGGQGSPENASRPAVDKIISTVTAERTNAGDEQAFRTLGGPDLVDKAAATKNIADQDQAAAQFAEQINRNEDLTVDDIVNAGNNAGEQTRSAGPPTIDAATRQGEGTVTSTEPASPVRAEQATETPPGGKTGPDAVLAQAKDQSNKFLEQTRDTLAAQAATPEQPNEAKTQPPATPEGKFHIAGADPEMAANVAQARQQIAEEKGEQYTGETPEQARARAQAENNRAQELAAAHQASSSSEQSNSTNPQPEATATDKGTTAENAVPGASTPETPSVPPSGAPESIPPRAQEPGVVPHLSEETPESVVEAAQQIANEAAPSSSEGKDAEPEAELTPEQQAVADRKQGMEMARQLGEFGITPDNPKYQELVDMLAEKPELMEQVKVMGEAFSAIRDAGSPEAAASAANASAESLSKEVEEDEAKGLDISKKKALIAILLAIGAAIAVASISPAVAAVGAVGLAGAVASRSANS